LFRKPLFRSLFSRWGLLFGSARTFRSLFSESPSLPSPERPNTPVGVKNKVEIRGMFFTAQKQAVTAPRLPRIPPQLHHENTTPKTPIFTKHPSKTPANPH
jgi:hypothetical protein